MTTLAQPPAGSTSGNRPGESGGNGVAAPAGAATPALASGVELLGEVEGSGYRRSPSLVRRADGQTIQITPLLYRLLELVDGSRGHEELADELGRRVGKQATADDVRYLLEEKVRPLGLLRGDDGAEPEVEKSNPLLGLRFKYVVSNPRITSRIAAPFAALLHPVPIAAVTLAFLVLTWWIAFEQGLASAVRQALYQPQFLLLALVLTLLSAGFHELGHAAACRYSGAKPGAMGVGLYLVWPAFYTDVSDSYRLARGGRLRVDLGGLYFNAIFALAIAGVWVAVGADALLLVIAAQLVQMVRQLVPVVRFDGYHVLADLTGVPDLFHHIKPTLLGLLPWRRGRGEGAALKPWARAVVTAWVLLVVPVLLALLTLAVLLLPRIAATAWDSIGRQADALAANWSGGDFASVAVGVLSIAGISLPVAGTVYILTRVARRAAGGTWRATADNPALRTAATLGAVTLLGGLVWAWWPGEQYRPIQPGERWTLVSGSAPVTAGGSASASAPAASGQGGEWMLVLVPASTVAEQAESGTEPESGGTRESPFTPPEAPGEGDNQALSLNTTDGSTSYSSALALVWVEDGETVDNRNEAYALASCRDCTTVAVAFQIVLVVGYSQVVVPENVAVAVNYECERCVTHSLAMQLVATLTAPPSDATRAEIARIWADLQDASEDFELLPLDEVYAALATARNAILEVVARENASVPSAPEGLSDEETADATEPGSTPDEESTPSEDTTTTTTEVTTTAPEEDGEPPQDDGESEETDGETPP
jgi:putative peptide zinc metalloprotease protein